MALIDVNWKPDNRQLRQFAVLFVIFVGGFAAVHYFRGGSPPVSQVLGGLAALVGLLGLAVPQLVRPLYVVMMAVALPIGLVVSSVLLSLIFYLLMTPIGLALRLVGYDAMHRRFDRAAESYWIRRPAAAAAERYFKQF